MGRPKIPKSVKKDFKRNMQQVVLDLSQPLLIVQESPSFVDCPNCLWDSINRKSSNVYDASFTSPTSVFVGTDQERLIAPISFTAGRCPVCVGEGQLFTTKEVCIPAMINFVGSGGSGGNFKDLPAGKEGTNFLIVKTLACHYDLIARNAIFVVHGNIKCEKSRPPLVRGLGGEETVAEVLLQTTEAGQLSTGKFDSSDHPLGSRVEDPRRRIKGPSDLRTLRGQIKGQ